MLDRATLNDAKVCEMTWGCVNDVDCINTAQKVRGVTLARDLPSETAYRNGLVGMEASGEDRHIPVDVLSAAGCSAGGNARSRCRAGSVHRRAATSRGHTITACFYTVTVGRRAVVKERAAIKCRCDRAASHCRRPRRKLATGLPRGARAAATGRRRARRFRRPHPPRRVNRARRPGARGRRHL
jgi:hypothetical protein